MDNKGIHPRSSPCDVDNLLSEGFVAEGAEMTKSKNTTVLTIVATQRWEQPRSIQVQPDTGVDKLCLINTTYPPPYPAGPGWIRSLPRMSSSLRCRAGCRSLCGRVRTITFWVHSDANALCCQVRWLPSLPWPSHSTSNKSRTGATKNK